MEIQKNKNIQGKINAPSMAYKTVYGKYPEFQMRGRTNSPKKIWNGNDVDINLKDEWLEELNSLPVEIRSTDEGKDKERVAFVIFRMPEGEDDLSENVVENLKKEKNLYVLSNIGQGDRPRICVAKDIAVGDSEWEEWWNSLAGKIKRAYEDSKTRK